MVLALFRQFFSSDSHTASTVKLTGCTVHLPTGARSTTPAGPWTLPTGESLDLSLQRGVPPLPKVEIWLQLVAHLKASLPSDSKLVECEPAVVDGHPALTTIVRTDTKGEKVGYKGRMIVPLRDRYWDFIITAVELGGSADRDATLIAAHAEPSGKLPADFDPDHSKYDFRFPHHSVTRIRKVLAHLSTKVNFDAGLMNAVAFPLPSWSATPSGVMAAVRHGTKPPKADDE